MREEERKLANQTLSPRRRSVCASNSSWSSAGRRAMCGSCVWRREGVGSSSVSAVSEASRTRASAASKRVARGEGVRAPVRAAAVRRSTRIPRRRSARTTRAAPSSATAGAGGAHAPEWACRAQRPTPQSALPTPAEGRTTPSIPVSPRPSNTPPLPAPHSPGSLRAHALLRVVKSLSTMPAFLQRALVAPQLLPLIRSLRAPRSHALGRKTHGGGSDRVMCLAKASQPVVLKPTSRPSLDDVDRLSRGEAAKRRGTGSRAVPHRLNEEEMRAFTVSKVRGGSAQSSARLPLLPTRPSSQQCPSHSARLAHPPDSLN